MIETSTTELPAIRTLAAGRRFPLRLRLGLAFAASAILAVITFAPSIGHPFIYDDHPFIENNPAVTKDGPWYRFWREPFWPRGTGPDTLYRPFTTWTYRVDVVLGGTGKPEPRVVHMTNIALHALASVGVVLIAFGVSRRVPAGLVAGILFAVHPLHTEAVVPGYGRSEVLAGCFGACLLAMQVNVRRPRPKWFYPLCSLVYLLAIMSKEHALFLWPTFIAIEYWPGTTRRPTEMSRREWLNRVLIPSQIGLILATSIYLTLRAGVFKDVYVMDASHTRFWECPLQRSGIVEHVLTPFRLLWISFQLCLRPGQLCPLWYIPSTPLADRLAPDVLGGMGVFAALVGLTVFYWRGQKLFGALVAALILTLIVPVQAIAMAKWLFAERWLYLPTVLVAALAGLAAARLRWPGVALALAAGLALLPASWSYSRTFESDMAMNREVIARQPDNYQGHRYLGGHLLFAGDYQAAIQHSHEMIERFEPYGPTEDAYAVLTLAYLGLGDGERALESVHILQRLRADVPDPSWTAKEYEARALVNLKRAGRAESQPATATTPGG